ncbi:hypothetical protein QS306_16965 [Paraburkholderia bonniea]|uniref:hypothetical protein n=1 Tax=Paraburkholderia bonniea TaxID=2152891 RepID=UPI001290F166|nr:hypothetical protein [Paraburkholderia bonniea]WJF91761.1 hypothetical protein QS306_16965 [Paraburkholderia bonniea]WJF95081.1 hypothetical protein QS308_16970 [Paraburkholderia bonniea]
MKFPHSSAPAPRQQRGQAGTEYLVITMAIALALVVAGVTSPSTIDQLVDAFKSLFSAYSFTLSLP